MFTVDVKQQCNYNYNNWPSQGGTSVLSPLSCSLFFGSLYSVVSIVFIWLICILALRSPVLQFQLPALLLVCVLFVLFFLLFVVVLSGEPRQKQGRGLVDHKLVQAPSNFYCWPSQGGSSVLVLW